MEDLEVSVAKLTQKAQLLGTSGCGSAPAQMGWTWDTAHSGLLHGVALQSQLWHLVLKSNHLNLCKAPAIVLQPVTVTGKSS